MKRTYVEGVETGPIMCNPRGSGTGYGVYGAFNLQANFGSADS